MFSEELHYQELRLEVIENNRQLDLIFNTLPQSMALVNPDYEILRVNNNFLSLYGVKNEDVIGFKCYNACFSRDTVCEGCLVQKAIESKKTEKKIKSFPNGEICEMTARPVLNHLGEVTHILDIRTNITELVEKDRELRRIQFAMNQSTDEFWLFDKNWDAVYISNSASENLGYSLAELRMAPLEKFNLLPRIENLPSLFQKLKKKKNIRIESVQFKKDGSTYPCEMNLSYFSDTEEFVYAVVRNITKRKKYENELIESREKAERALRLKSSFLANMSHEIRTPLNAIIGFSNFVLEEELDDSTKIELKNEIRDNSQYLLSIISDIMEISQIDSGNRTVDNKLFSVSELMKQQFSDFQKITNPQVSFIFECNIPSDADELVSDKNLIRQMLERLLSNAVKFTSKGEIEMGCEYNEKRGYYMFYVRDSGIGIAPENLDEIFEPFHQLNSMIRGVGIGLTICKLHAQMLRSAIKVESAPGKGSTFSFRIKK
jgi:PAS domain S-box-containing protein